MKSSSQTEEQTNFNNSSKNVYSDVTIRARTWKRSLDPKGQARYDRALHDGRAASGSLVTVMKVKEHWSCVHKILEASIFKLS